MPAPRSRSLVVVLFALLAVAASPAVAMPGPLPPRLTTLEPGDTLAEPTMFRGNAARTGVNPGPAPAGPPAFLWRYKLNGSWGTPAVGDEVVVIQYPDGLVAVDRDTGEERWTVAQPASSSSPLVAGGMVYVGTWGEGRKAIDAATGEVVWQFLTGGEGVPDGPPPSAFDSSPTYAGGVIYVGEGPYGGLFALDAATGAERWRIATHGGTPSSPAVADGIVYVATETVLDPDQEDTTPSRIYAVDAATGAERWHLDLGPGETSFSAPAVAGGAVYAGVSLPENNTGYWLAIDAASGEERWRFETPTSGVWGSSAAVAGGLVYVSGIEDFTLYALDAATGDEAWSYQIEGGLYTPPVIVGEAVYVQGDFDTLLRVLDAGNGEELWTLPVGGGGSPTIVDGRIYTAGAGYLYAIGSADDPAAVEFPARPEPPAMGPGSPNTHYPGSRATHYGPEPGGYWIIEPTTGPEESDPLAAGPLPLVIALPGCCGPGDYTVPRDQMGYWRHIAQQGHVVVLPVYNAYTVMEDVERELRSALTELDGGDHPAVDLERVGVIGHSFGGPAAIAYAAGAAADGLPVPDAVFVLNSCEGNDEGHECVEVPADLTLPTGIKLLVWVADQDFVVGSAPSERIWAALSSVPAEDRDFVTMVSDDHGHLPIVADHNNIGGEEYYTIGKLTDALLACAFSGDFCQYALGNTPEQRFAGEWSDGVPVAELRVTDDPGAPQSS